MTAALDYAVWFGVVGLFILGDLATTWGGIWLELGDEANPMTRSLFRKWGRTRTWVYVVVFKTLLGAWAMASYMTAENVSHELLAYGLSALGIYLVVHNIRVLYRERRQHKRWASE